MAPEGSLPADYPVNLKLVGRKCLVVGGGQVAERKVAALLEAGADVFLIGPELSPQLAKWAAVGRLRHEAADFRDEAVTGCLLVFCATSSPAMNRRVAAVAKAAGILVNVADSPDLCDFTLPARLQRGDFTLAVSTHGSSPALARDLRDELAGWLGEEYGVYLAIVGRIRREWQKCSDDSAERCRRWREARGFDLAALELLRQGKIKEAEDRIRHVVGGFGTEP